MFFSLEARARPPTEKVKQKRAYFKDKLINSKKMRMMMNNRKKDLRMVKRMKKMAKKNLHQKFLAQKPIKVKLDLLMMLLLIGKLYLRWLRRRDLPRNNNRGQQSKVNLMKNEPDTK